MRALVLFTSLDVASLGAGHVELTEKFVSGMGETRRSWGGDVVMVSAPRTRLDTNLDQRAWRPSELPFRLEVRAPGESVDDIVHDAAIVSICSDYRHVAVAAALRRLHVPHVVVAEYDLRTRLAIAAVDEPSLRKRTKRMLWCMGTEARMQRMIAGASGLQCNGTPTYDAWAKLSPSPLLYFDTRVAPSMLATSVRAGTEDRPLRLAFSGRFLPMKGVLHLVEIASRLRARGVRFEMRLYGAGPLEDAMRALVRERSLGDAIAFEGNLPFSELMRRVSRDVDLFVCTHVQGDPSCTYLETLSCAVPIVGFANGAWAGLLERSKAGWSAPVGDDEGIARIIEQLDGNRAEITAAGTRALAFAHGHTFDLTFARRSAHLRELAR